MDSSTHAQVSGNVLQKSASALPPEGSKLKRNVKKKEKSPHLSGGKTPTTHALLHPAAFTISH